MGNSGSRCSNDARHEHEGGTEGDAAERCGGGIDLNVDLRIGLHGHHATAALDRLDIGGDAGDAQRPGSVENLVDIHTGSGDNRDEVGPDANWLTSTACAFRLAGPVLRPSPKNPAIASASCLDAGLAGSYAIATVAVPDGGGCRKAMARPRICTLLDVSDSPWAALTATKVSAAANPHLASRDVAARCRAIEI